MRMMWKKLAIAGLALTCFTGLVLSSFADRSPVQSAIVKIVLPAGHGSGVHIGNGYILTAEHVASKGEVTIKSDAGDIRPGTVLWSNADYDIALIRAKPDRLGVADLNCADLAPGQAVIAFGNPTELEFISTNGRVAGTVRSVGEWKVVFPVDMTILPGMSGGPVLDTNGRVAGINVGVLTAPIGFASSFTGIGVAVPSSVVCELLAR